MAAPVVALAGKAAAQWFARKFKDGDSRTMLIGGLVSAVFMTMIVPVVVIVSLVTSIGAGSGADPCTLQNAGFGVNGSPLKVVSWNVCAKSCGNWNDRIERVERDLESMSPDVVALQESGVAKSRSGPTMRMMTRLGYANVQPKAAPKNVFLYYRKDAFTVSRAGYTPTAPKPYGFVWAELTNTSTGAQFIASSVHMDYRPSAAGGQSRKAAAAKMIARLDQVNSKSLPVIVAGDFNSNQSYKAPRNQPFPTLLGKWDDAASVAAEKIGTNKSSTRGRGKGKVKNGKPIDHVLVPKGVTVQRFENRLADGSGFSSDHNPVIADIGLPGGVDAGGAVSASASKDIPPVALRAYRKAGAATGVDWSYIAAIGKVETNHGRYGGSKMDSEGNVRPKIRNSIGASGPMQFMPPTWGQYKQDGNFDGVKSVDNIYDAALAAGRYLNRSGAPGNMRKAIFAYNRADWYVDKVIKQAKVYSASVSGGPVNVPAGALDLTTASAAGSSSWVRPVRSGPVTARFGQRGGMWSLGYHTGTDFGVPTGTEIYAAQSGSISLSHPAWAGNLLTINHGSLDGKNIKSQYAHLSRVKVSSGTVQAGELIGYAGARGNVTGPHLHFEVLANGKYVNPESYLSGAGTPIFVGDTEAGAGCSDTLSVGDEAQNTEWSGNKNGRVALTDLCAIKAQPSAKLRCDAARSLDSLNTAYKKKFGSSMKVDVAYRDYAAQVQCRAANPECEKPGSSRYGFGLVVKFAKPLGSTSTAEYRWMTSKGVGAGWAYTDGAWEFGKTA